MLSNFDLEKLGDVYDIKINGVYAKDKIPENANEGWYIINMQNLNDGNGTHWITFLKEKNKKSVYIDSYGIIPPLEIINSLNDNYIYNDTQIQALHNDDNCGLYCISAICFWKIQSKKDNENILKQYKSLFSKETKNNKYILKDFLNKYYNSYVKK
jgi:hypothetical protein